MKDPARAKSKLFEKLLETGLRQLAELAECIEETKSVMRWAKTPQERTAMNVILDDQKKAARALERFVSDLPSEEEYERSGR